MSGPSLPAVAVDQHFLLARLRQLEEPPRLSKVPLHQRLHAVMAHCAHRSQHQMSLRQCNHSVQTAKVIGTCLEHVVAHR